MKKVDTSRYYGCQGGCQPDLGLLLTDDPHLLLILNCLNQIMDHCQMKMRACDYIVEIMKIIGKVSSSSLQHNVNRNFEERRQLKDQKSNQIEKLYAYHIILNSIQLVTGIPGGNIQLYVVSSVMDLIRAA